MADVRELFDQPVFSMNFDSPTSWPDVSSFAGDVTCGFSACPARVAPGVAGSAANLRRHELAQRLRPATKPGRRPSHPERLGLSEERRDGNADTWPQGIMGYHSMEADAYPYLIRQGLKIRFGLADSTQYKSKHDHPGRRPHLERLEPRRRHIRRRRPCRQAVCQWQPGHAGRQHLPGRDRDRLHADHRRGPLQRSVHAAHPQVQDQRNRRWDVRRLVLRRDLYGRQPGTVSE